MSNPELTRWPSALDRHARQVVRALQPQGPHRRSAALTLARGLGWFSIGLGLLELLAARPLATRVGLRGRETLLQGYGLREIGVGLGLLLAAQPQAASRWAWGRVAGDALDLATLGLACAEPHPHDAHARTALLAVAGVTLVDVACARALQQQAHARQQTTDYSDRSGLPLPPDVMRGSALDDFVQPDDMRASPRPAALAYPANDAASEPTVDPAGRARASSAYGGAEQAT